MTSKQAKTKRKTFFPMMIFLERFEISPAARGLHFCKRAVVRKGT